MKFKLYAVIFFLSLSTICFEILATRVTSVIFVSDYAYIILSLAILGLGCGAILFSTRLHQQLRIEENALTWLLLLYGMSLCLFIGVIVIFSVTNPLIYFILLWFPFILAGITYALIFKVYAELSFRIYASDLSGAALGALLPLFVINTWSVPNTILILGILLSVVGSTIAIQQKKKLHYIMASILICCGIILLVNGRHEFLGRVPIGRYPEKDFYYVYPNLNIQREILESRWSVYGRSDLVRHSHQDFVRHLFIDGAAGSPMYRFDGNIHQPSKLLLDQLVHETTTLPFLCFREYEKDSVLIIGPGGGREVLIGLLSNVKTITGVEINPDFVALVQAYRNFNGGIYTDFPNVHINVQEGRNYIKYNNERYDAILMALPSTEQMQHIDALAANENYLLTKEALHDYFKILSSEGYMIFTLHNDWEVIRLIVTTISAFEDIGKNVRQTMTHFAVIESEVAPPSLVIKKEPFTLDEIHHWQNSVRGLPKTFPRLTFIGKNVRAANMTDTQIQRFMQSILENSEKFSEIVNEYPLNIAPCRDDSPYFYKIRKGLPPSLKWLLVGVAILNIVLITYFVKRHGKSKKIGNDNGSSVRLFIVFALLGAGFMMIEISLFQKLVLYLGAPTISLSILLCSLLIGMGVGSYSGSKLFLRYERMLQKIVFLIVIYGALLFVTWIIVFNTSFIENYLIRVFFIVGSVLPFGFLLGIPFPASIHLLESLSLKKFIPWMYGINGTMSVLGSVIVAAISMLFGFTLSYFLGVACYFVIAIYLQKNF